MHGRWITKLPELLGKNVSNTDILLVKLVTLTRTKSHDNVKYDSNTRICTAAFESYDSFIRWYIHDVFDDCLLIDTPVEGTVYLGHSSLNCSKLKNSNYVQEEDEIDALHIITACKVLPNESLKEKFIVNFCETDVSYAIGSVPAEMLNEAKAIKTALNANGINAQINENN